MSELHAWDVPEIGLNVGRRASDDALFRELAEVLLKHNALDRFGITLLHKHFDIAPNEALLETTDTAAREQKMTVINRADFDKLGAVETSWRLGPNGEALWGCVCVPDRETGQCGRHVVTQ